MNEYKSQTLEEESAQKDMQYTLGSMSIKWHVK